VLTASGGRECLSLAEREKPNLIFLDIAMPEMDGWQVAQRLRQLSPERVAIVVLSANAIDAARLMDGERLHDDYLMKPIDLRQLLKTIHALLNIEWIYGLEEASAPDNSLPIQFPPLHDINEFIRLGEIGHVRRIQEKLSGLEREAPEYARFVNQMRAFVNAFDLKRYLAALEGIRGGHA
jgi:CheY-like chemotaxis protein